MKISCEIKILNMSISIFLNLECYFVRYKKMMGALDKDRSGYIDYEEFIDAVRSHKI